MDEFAAIKVTDLKIKFKGLQVEAPYSIKLN